MRYRPETPLVLKGLNVSIGAGERIGVVGRTGSGKSSMLLVFMRIVEPYLSEDLQGEKYEPPIVIDGVDVMRIGYDFQEPHPIALNSLLFLVSNIIFSILFYV
jgi:ABC-type bacteriocin/lantibiotic exporter with double-glycine peptidase domain